MPSRKPNRVTPELDYDERESVFTGEESVFPMVGEASATQGFHAIPLIWHTHGRLELLMLLSGVAAYECRSGSDSELSGGQMLVVPAARGLELPIREFSC